MVRGSVVERIGGWGLGLSAQSLGLGNLTGPFDDCYSIDGRLLVLWVAAWGVGCRKYMCI